MCVCGGGGTNTVRGGGQILLKIYNAGGYVYSVLESIEGESRDMRTRVRNEIYIANK